jgi:cell wall-associated NlpC family hydrolase
MPFGVAAAQGSLFLDSILGAMARRFLVAVTLALVLAPAANAADSLGVAEIRQADGTLVRRAGTGSFAYPADGSVLSVVSSKATAAGVTLEHVSILGGRIQIDRLVVPAKGLAGARVENLVVDGLLRDASPNAVFSLDGGDYAVVLQQATVPGAGKRTSGVVGLRVFLGAQYGALPAGTQILVGLARAAQEQTRSTVSAESAMPWAVLGLSGTRVPGLSSTPEPFAGAGLAVPGSPAGVHAVVLAERFLGTPYVWGGAAPGGFDCSGLVMYVYAQLGLSLPHFTGYQWNVGRRLGQNDPLQAGDLVFFHMHSYGPGHEGMYIGNGQFIHAPHSGDVVKISSLSDPEYALGYVGAVRVTF